MSGKNYRLRELDFLRGIAIILVLLNHQPLSEFTSRMGWIGVDLFFVLSGFLVSGLLFKEYIKFGDIHPKRFLIRRGFKIYPVYYLFYILYLAPILIKHKLDIFGMLSDLLFVQNYYWGWGYAYSPGWSLAVEEHFYLIFSLLLYWGLKTKTISLREQNSVHFSKFEYIIVVILFLCLALRFYTNLAFPDEFARQITMTHLRLDSLLVGVFIGYWYYFKKEFLIKIFQSHKKVLLIFAIGLLSFTPFVDHTHSFFAKTIGFSMLYVAFGILLSWFLTDWKINIYLDKYCSTMIVNGISKIGFASYSIYIIHAFVNYALGLFLIYVLKVELPRPIHFLTAFVITVSIGIFMTKYIEGYFLNVRDKFFPARNAESKIK